MLNETAGFALGVWTALLFCAMRYLLETEKARQGVCRQRSPATGFKKPQNHLCLAVWLQFIFSFIFLLLWLLIGEKARNYGAFPGNQPGNGSATKSATRWDFQKGSSICSVTSTNPSGIFSAPLLVSVAGASRSQPFCLPYSGNIRGLEK